MQHSQPQQSLTFALVLVEAQHSCEGLQHSAPGAQQLTFMLDVPPPKMPKSSAKGASSFKVITDLQSFKWLSEP
jgi:hypothetical protein